MKSAQASAKNAAPSGDGTSLLKEAMSKELTHFELPVKSVTSMLDPVDDGAKHFYAFVAVKNIPHRIRHFNVRSPNIGSRMYKKVVSDLFIKSKSFHLNNRGIIILAESAEVKGSNLIIDLGKNGGIMDGGRTDRILRENGSQAPESQHVFVQVRIAIPESRHTDMAMGLNTSAQVQKESLLHFDGAFDKIKKAIVNQPYAEKISWEEGTKKQFPTSVVEIIRYLTVMNINIWPVKPHTVKRRIQLGITAKAQAPVLAACGANDLLNFFDSHEKFYDNMYHLVPQILLLRDHIESRAIHIYNKGPEGTDEKRGSYLGFVTAQDSGKKSFLRFSNDKTYYTMTQATVLLLMGAMRVTLKVQGDKIVFDGGLQKAKDTFDSMAYDLVNSIALRVKGHPKDSVPTYLFMEAKREDFWDAMINKAISSL